MTGAHGEGTVWQEMGSMGGRMVVPEYGVSLTIPEGSLPPDVSHKFFLAVLPRAKLFPPLNEKQVCIFLNLNNPYTIIIYKINWYKFVNYGH